MIAALALQFVLAGGPAYAQATARATAVQATASATITVSSSSWSGPSATPMPVGPLPGSINATSYGVSTSSNDNTSAMQSALNACKSETPLYIPAGTYNFAANPNGANSYTPALNIPGGCYVDGAGASSTILSWPSTMNSTEMGFGGSDAAIGNLTLYSAFAYGNPSEPGRTANPAFNPNVTGDVPGNSTWQIDHVIINGSSGGGTVSYGGSGFFITNNTIENTNADCIGSYDGASNGLVENNYIYECGDDGISNVAYSAPAVSNITITNNVVEHNYWGRNFSAVGCTGCTFTNNYAKGNTVGISCLVVISDGGVVTLGNSNIVIDQMTLDGTDSTDGNCGNTSSGYASAFDIYGSSAYPNSAVFENSYITNPSGNGSIWLVDAYETLTLSNYLVTTVGTVTNNGGTLNGLNSLCTSNCTSIGYQPAPVGYNGQTFTPPAP
jgi:Right handed beta helix region